MNFARPIPFAEAIQHLASKRLMPTSMGSADLAGVSAAIKRSSLFSARTTLEGLLDAYKTGVDKIINPVQVVREGVEQTVTEGETTDSLRSFIKQYLKDTGYRPEPDKEGTIQDLSSDARVQLVVKTNVQLAQGAGNFVASNDPDAVAVAPAQELVRFEDRDQPRNWDGTNPNGDKALTGFGSRWMRAAQAASDADAARVLEETGRMVALKSSGIWQELGNFQDGLGNPYPPFAFNSGMWVQDVMHQEAVELGLLKAGEQAQPADFDFASLFKLPT